MWLCQIRVMRKSERSTCLKLDGCQTLLLSQEQTHVRGVTLACMQLQGSLSETEFPLSFISAFFSFPLNLASFIPSEPRGISFDGTVIWVVCTCLESVWPHQRCWTEQSRPATGTRSPVGPKFWPRIEGHSAPHWIPGCNSPSVCGLGWCGGRGELQVSHGKACFIVCLREWRIEGREGERERDGRRWGWEVVVEQQGRRAGRKGNELKKIRIDEILTWRQMKKKCVTSEGREVDTSNSICQSPSSVILSFSIWQTERQFPLSRTAVSTWLSLKLRQYAWHSICIKRQIKSNPFQYIHAGP